jgi:hypothetical protein
MQSTEIRRIRQSSRGFSHVLLSYAKMRVPARGVAWSDGSTASRFVSIKKNENADERE